MCIISAPRYAPHTKDHDELYINSLVADGSTAIFQLMKVVGNLQSDGLYGYAMVVGLSRVCVTMTLY